MKRTGVPMLLAGLLALTIGARGVPPLVVHEWGTITTHHQPNGVPVGSLNHIARSEVLPPFVHTFEPAPTAAVQDKQLVKTPLLPGRPDVTMRLETPVLYFHPAAGTVPTPLFDVSVHFRGGVLNEFYPNAEASVALDFDRINAKMHAGLINGTWNGDVLNNDVVGALRWHDVRLRNTVTLAKTENPVWLAPRRVQSAGVTDVAGEGERYLFYRGVAHLDALVQTELMPHELVLRSPRHLEWLMAPAMTLRGVWLADIDADGRVAFREQTQLVVSKAQTSAELARLPLFSAEDYSADGLAALRRSMKQALTAAGLFDDEAEAMLETWKESYFHTPGLRLFYMVPGEWLAYYLPLDISVPHELTRVLVGRIDFVAQGGGNRSQ